MNCAHLQKMAGLLLATSALSFVTSGCLRTPCAKTDFSCESAAWLTQFGSCPTTRSWHTHLGIATGNHRVLQIEPLTNGAFAISGVTDQNILAGSPIPFSGAPGTNNVFVMKLNADGATEWSTYLGESGGALQRLVADEGGVTIATTANVGSIFGNARNAQQGGLTDFMIARINLQGGLVWNTYHGSIGDDQAEGIARTADGGFVITGRIENSFAGASGATRLPHPAPGNTTGGAVKINAAGDAVFNTSIGNLSSARLIGVTVAPDQNIYVMGSADGALTAAYSNALTSYPGGGENGLLAKLDSDGNYLFHTFQGEATANQRLVVGVNQADSGLIVATPSSQSYGTPLNPHASPGSGDFAISKYDRDGGLLWLTFLGGTGVDDLAGGGPTWDGQGIWVAGTAPVGFGSPLPGAGHTAGTGNGLAAVLGTNGELQHLAFFGASGATLGIFDVHPTCDLGLALVGQTTAAFGSNPLQAYPSGAAVGGLVIRLDSMLGLGSR